MTKKTLCYIGDLPDRRVDGITISFQRNLSILSSLFRIIQTPESGHLKGNLYQRIKTVLAFWTETKTFIKNNQTDLAYINLPVSVFGAIKIYGLLILINKECPKSVLHVHRGDFKSLINKSWLYKWLLARIVKRIDRLILLSQKEQKSLRAYFKTNKVVHLSNAIDLPEKVATSKNYGDKFIYISNYLETKGIFDLLEVFKKIKDLSLVCHGAFPNEDIERKIKSYTSEHISIQGQVDRKHKYEIMKGASCLILPSWSEGQPLVILEAMSQSLPIIATDVGFIKEMVGEDYPYLINAHDPQALHEAIIKANHDPGLSQIGQKLKQRFDENFSSALHRNALIDIFKPFSV